MALLGVNSFEAVRRRDDTTHGRNAHVASRHGLVAHATFRILCRGRGRDVSSRREHAGGVIHAWVFIRTPRSWAFRAEYREARDCLRVGVKGGRGGLSGGMGEVSYADEQCWLSIEQLKIAFALVLSNGAPLDVVNYTTYGGTPMPPQDRAGSPCYIQNTGAPPVGFTCGAFSRGGGFGAFGGS